MSASIAQLSKCSVDHVSIRVVLRGPSSRPAMDFVIDISRAHDSKVAWYLDSDIYIYLKGFVIFVFQNLRDFRISKYEII